MRYDFSQLSNHSIYLVAENCPTCDSKSRFFLEEGRRIATKNLKRNNQLGFIVVQAGSIRYSTLLRNLRENGLSSSWLPLYFFNGSWFSSPETLQLAVGEYFKEPRKDES